MHGNGNASLTWATIGRALAGLVAAVMVSLLGHVVYMLHGLDARVERLAADVEAGAQREQRSYQDLKGTQAEIAALQAAVGTLASNVRVLSRELRELRIE